MQTLELVKDSLEIKESWEGDTITCNGKGSSVGINIPLTTRVKEYNRCLNYTQTCNTEDRHRL